MKKIIAYLMWGSILGAIILDFSLNSREEILSFLTGIAFCVCCVSAYCIMKTFEKE